MSSLAPDLAAGPSYATPRRDSPPTSARSPEEIRRLLSIYRTGMERGRQEASDVEQERRGDDRPPSFRSDT
jgi:hypothetical protein